ncbi:hypothetical protein [Acetobacter sp.]|jgi:hypothetical protein|uniref:hypothetical protein n=1 Tax=Acetobacter sp. TaxID=440 RepID=UPI0025B89DC4|nr:hypothetical protein [Acetobacter sp.]MCH4089947.1 hypothetical protein [Acetobacter sp.]MCI1298643.1 hypothetical protein [Acetobacter sp.]MCI1315208.1 hypothetical protein [Acetobacter sp.]
MRFGFYGFLLVVGSLLFSGTQSIAQDDLVSNIKTLEQSGDWTLKVSKTEHSALLESQQDGFIAKMYLNGDSKKFFFLIGVYARSVSNVTLSLNDDILEFPTYVSDGCPSLFQCFLGQINTGDLPGIIHNFTSANKAFITFDGKHLPMSLVGTSDIINALDKYNAETGMNLPSPFHNVVDIKPSNRMIVPKEKIAEKTCINYEENIHTDGNPFNTNGKCYKLLIGLLSRIQWIDKNTALVIPKCGSLYGCGIPMLIHSDEALKLGRWTVVIGRDPYQYTAATGELTTALSFQVVRYLSGPVLIGAQ